jgi:hypothetical protein
MRAELTKPLFASVAGLALAMGAVACGGSADGDPTQWVDNGAWAVDDGGGQAGDGGARAVDNGGQAVSAATQERADGYQPPCGCPVSLFGLPPIILPVPPAGGTTFPPFTLPSPPDGGLFGLAPIAPPPGISISLPGLLPDGGITIPLLPGFPGH